MTPKNKTNFINVIKLIAFFMVFLLHAKIFAPENWNEGVKLAWITYTPSWAGVWIFLIFSGYGIGCGFSSGKYDLTKQGLISYLKKRALSIIPVYYIYLLVVLVFVCPQLLLPSGENFIKLLKLFLFDYKAEFGTNDFGAVWYLSTLVRLYLLTPIFYFVFKKILSKKKLITTLMIILGLVGLLSRLGLKFYMNIKGIENWSSWVYIPFYMNIDMYFSGFLLSFLKTEAKKLEVKSYEMKKYLGLILFIVLVFANSYIYYVGSYEGKLLNIYIYQYIFPTIYLIVIVINIYILEIKRNYQYMPINKTNIKLNKFRIIDFFPSILLPMYLFHSNILRNIQTVVSEELVINIASKLNYNGTLAFLTHMIIISISLPITLGIGCILSYLSIKNKSKL